MSPALEKTLRYVAIGALTAAALVPFYVASDLFFPFISGKNFALRILIEIAIAAWLLLAFRNKTYRPSRSCLMWSAAFFIATLAIATVLAEDPFKSFWSNFERMEGFIGMAHFALAFLVAGSMFRTVDWRRFTLVSLSVNAVIIGYALLQFFGFFAINQGGVRVDATFGNAIYLGVYALFHLFFALLAAYTAVRECKSRYLIAFFIALALGNIALIFLSATRGIVLGLFVGGIVACALLAMSPATPRVWKRIGVIGLICAALAIGGFFTLRETSLRNHPLFGRILSASPINDDAQARFTIWKIALKGAAERPLFGWGQEGFGFVFSKYYDPHLLGREVWFDRAHNAFLDWLVAAGVFGLIGYLALWTSAARRAISFTGVERALFFGFGAAYAVNNLFVFDNGVSHFLFFMLLAYLQYRGTNESEDKALGASAVNNAFVRLVAPSVVIALVFSVYYFNVRPAYAGTILLQALRSHPEGPLENLALFQKALSLRTLATAEIREQLAQVTIAVAPIDGVPIEVKREFLTLAASELDKEIQKRLFDARYYTFMGALLDGYGLYDQGLHYWDEALQQSPQKQVTMFQAGVNRVRAKKPNEALVYFKQAYELPPDKREAVLMYLVGLIYAGERAEEERVLETIPLDVIETIHANVQLIAAYEATGRLNTARELAKKRLASPSIP